VSVAEGHAWGVVQITTRESTTAAPGRIFVSYRREDTAYPAGWLVDRLTEHFGPGQVFKDVDSIELGDDFVEAISAAVGSCDVLLALIGGEWLTITGDDGRRRLDDPGDFVRVEIEAALRRDVRVIPILVDGAKMPRADQLPPSLVGLQRRQALELSPNRFDYDTSRLVRVLDATLAEMQTAQLGVASTTRPATPRLPGPQQPEPISTPRPRHAPASAVAGESLASREGLLQTGGPDVRQRLRWVLFGLLVVVVIVLLASRDAATPALMKGRRFQLQNDAWILFLWMAPALPVGIAAWLLARNRIVGGALGCVVAAAVWVASSWAAMEREDDAIDVPRTLLAALLLLLVATAVGIVLAVEDARDSVRLNPWTRSAVALTLVVLAALLRLESNPFGHLLVSKGGALDWALKVGQGTFWVGNVFPLVVAGLAATLLCNEFQSRALRAFVFLQVAHDLVIQMGSVLKQIDKGDVAFAFVVQSLVFLVGTLCLLWSVRIGQPRSRLVDGNA
jgi:hypothetical protein